MSTFIKSAYPLPRKGCALFYPTATLGLSLTTGDFLPLFSNTSYNDSSNIVYTSPTQILLKANKRYKLVANYFGDLSIAQNYVYYGIYNVGLSQQIGVGGVSVGAEWSTAHSCGNGPASCIVFPTEDAVISIRISSIGGTISSINNSASFVEIEELEAYLPASTGTQNINGNIVATGSVSGASITDTSLTTGSIPFSLSGVLSQDNTNLFWDNTNKRLNANLVTVQNYTKLGANAPSVQMKQLTGTTASTQGGTTTIAHGLTGDKIISVSVKVTFMTDKGIFSSYFNDAGYQFDYFHDETLVAINNSTGNSANILSKPFIVTIFYIA